MEAPSGLQHGDALRESLTASSKTGCHFSDHNLVILGKRDVCEYGGLDTLNDLTMANRQESKESSEAKHKVNV